MTAPAVKITILVDNNAAQGLLAEHGFALWIESQGTCLLFDTGQGHTIEHNARQLDIDLGKTDTLVLSHGHFDHTGGIPQVLRKAAKAHFYSHPGVVHPRYSIRNGTPAAIQMPANALAAIDKLPSERLHWVQQPLFLFDKIGLSGPIPRETDYENPGGPFFLDPEGTRPDRIDDDLALWIRTDEGAVVCVGCSHAGLVNTLQHVQKLNKDVRIRAVIGGFHLINADRRRLARTVDALRSLEPDLMVPCHCTGESALATLGGALGRRVSPGMAGMTFTF